jgi:hypothetical protein
MLDTVLKSTTANRSRCNKNIHILFEIMQLRSLPFSDGEAKSWRRIICVRRAITRIFNLVQVGLLVLHGCGRRMAITPPMRRNSSSTEVLRDCE